MWATPLVFALLLCSGRAANADLVSLAISDYESGEADRALLMFEQAADATLDPVAYCWMGSLQLLKAARAWDQDDWEHSLSRAMRSFQQCAMYGAKGDCAAIAQAGRHQIDGIKAFNRAEYEQAANHFTDAAQAWPDAASLGWLGACRERQAFLQDSGDVDGLLLAAIQSYESAVSLGAGDDSSLSEVAHRSASRLRLWRSSIITMPVEAPGVDVLPAALRDRLSAMLSRIAAPQASGEPSSGAEGAPSAEVTTQSGERAPHLAVALDIADPALLAHSLRETGAAWVGHARALVDREPATSTEASPEIGSGDTPVTVPEADAGTGAEASIDTDAVATGPWRCEMDFDGPGGESGLTVTFDVPRDGVDAPADAKDAWAPSPRADDLQGIASSMRTCLRLISAIDGPVATRAIALPVSPNVYAWAPGSDLETARKLPLIAVAFDDASASPRTPGALHEGVPPDMLTRALLNGGKVAVIGPDMLRHAATLCEKGSASTPVDVARRLGAQWLVTGIEQDLSVSLDGEGDERTLRARVRVRAGLAAVADGGEASDLSVEEEAAGPPVAFAGLENLANARPDLIINTRAPTQLRALSRLADSITNAVTGKER